MPQSSHPELSDEVLLESTRNGDSAAFAELWARHRRAGLAAARHLSTPSLADDVVSEAYLRIFELVQDGRGPRGAFRPYLYRTIQSIAIDHWRRPENTSDNLDDFPTLTEAGPWEDNAFDRNAAATAFATLNPRWQSVLWYTEVEGMPPREVAKVLGISANGVSAFAARAREALQSAWVEAHVNRELAEAECRSTLEHLQRYQRGRLTAALSRSVAEHLEACENCRNAAAEYATLNRQLALVLVGVLLGGGSAFTFLGGAGTGAPARAMTPDSGPSGTGGAESSSAGGPAASSTGPSAGSPAATSGAATVGAGFTGISSTFLLTAAAAGALAIGGVGVWIAAASTSVSGTSYVMASADDSARATKFSRTPEASSERSAPSGDTIPQATLVTPVDAEGTQRSVEQDHERAIVPHRESSASAHASGSADGSESGSNGTGSESNSGASAGANASADVTAEGSASAEGTSSADGSTHLDSNSDATAQSAATGAADASSHASGAAVAATDGASEAGSDGSTADTDTDSTATADAAAGASGAADSDGSTTSNGTEEGEDTEHSDPALSPTFTCWTSHGRPGEVYIYGTARIGGDVQVRVRLGEGQWVQSTENMRVQWNARWWSSHPLPLLEDGVDLDSATVQIRLLTSTSAMRSPWTTVQLGPAIC